MKLTFTKHGVTTIISEKGTETDGKGFEGSTEEEMKLTWMHDTKMGLFMHMELLACRDDLNWLMRCLHCAVNNYPKYHYPTMPLPVPRIIMEIYVGKGKWQRRVLYHRLSR